MSVNLGAYALISALAVGGAVAQHQYARPAGPPEDVQGPAIQQPDPLQQPSEYSNSPMASATGVLDCNTLMTHHQQMTTELDQLDQQAATLLSQMKDAKSDRARLEATMGVVEALVTQRKQIRDRMSTMEHETLQFVFANQGKDLKTSCPQMTEWLQKGAMNSVNTDAAESEEEGGPDDMELGNEDR
jgi:hypothetical protein